MSDLTADDIFTSGMSAPMPAAVKAVRKVAKGEDLDDELANTEAALASLFAFAHADRLQYDFRRKCWMVYDRGIWRQDRTGEAQRLLQSWCETRVFDQVASAMTNRDASAMRNAARRSLTARTLRALLELASTQLPLANSGEAWDVDPFLLVTIDGTVIDLRDGRSRRATPDDRLTLRCGVPYDPAATCDAFRAFVTAVCDDDPAQVRLLQLLAGYAATGATSEQVFAILIGSGSNGKSTLLEIWRHVLGTYSATVPFHILLRDRDTRSIPVEIAQLPGVRMAGASEVRDGAMLDEGRIKALSGDDTLTARGLYQAPFEFKSRAKLVLCCNKLPRVDDRSHAFWRRAIVIPFKRTFDGSTRDNSLSEKLRGEGAGILNWIIEGAVDWYREGLPKVAAAEVAKADWRESQDLIAQWADVTLKADTEGRLKASEAFKAFCDWATAEGLSDRERPGSRTFGEWMSDHFVKNTSNKGRSYQASIVKGEGLEADPVNPLTCAQGESSTNTLHTLHPSPTGGLRV
ncbi:MAG: phage/plasmid primase, P4 family [Acidobacteriota bacterium]|nr:phage/plasmid primase, P4 family [Acidobacteriota bacterium]